MNLMISIIIGLLSLFANAVKAEETLLFVTEEFPPYNYLENEQVKGLGLEVVREMTRRVSEHQVDIKMYPWLRAYKLAVKNENTAIFSLGRNIEREKLFHWVGVIAPAKFYLFSLKSRDDISISSLNDAKQFKVGTFPKTVREQYLLEQGFIKDQNLVSIYDYERLFEMLTLKRIDLWAMNELLANHIIKKKGYKMSETLKISLFLKDLSPEGYYLAFNKKTDSSIVAKYIKALASMKEDGLYQKIVARYIDTDL